MKKLYILALLSLAGSTWGTAETILLKNGNRLQGELLKKSDTQLFLDLGFDVLKIPMDQVMEIQEPEAAAGNQTDDAPLPTSARPQANPNRGERLFSQPKDRQTRSVKENAEMVGEAVVQIRTPSALGSGFVIHPEGYVITNNHVISGEHKISIILFNKTARELEKVQKQNIKIVATSPVMDLALLKIEGEEKPNFAYTPIGSSNDVRSGQSVFAVGSPLGLGRSVSQGIVSVRNRVVPGGLIYIQHTAQINPGNSGGPLFNLQGEVVGVLNMKMTSIGVEGMGFAVPASVLKLFLNNQNAYAFDPRNPNAGFRYLDPPGASDADTSEFPATEEPVKTATPEATPPPPTSDT